MLSYDTSSKGQLVASYLAKEKALTKFVFYDKKAKYEPKCDLDTKYLMTFEHGFNKARTGPRREQLELSNTYSMLRAPVHSGGSKGLNTLIPFYIARENQRFVHLITGKSGMGKSTLAKNLVKLYSKIMDVYIISPVEDDEFKGTFVKIQDLVEIDDSNDYQKNLKTYNRAKIKYKYRKHLINDPDDMANMEIMLMEMKPVKTGEQLYKLTKAYKEMIKTPTLFVFDDNEAAADQGRLKFLMDSQLLTGRHDDICMLILNHQSNDGCKTRNIINESNIFSIFEINRFTSYFMREYLQLSKNVQLQIRKMLKSSRSVTIYKNERLLLSENVIVSH